ncbi:hypothetical protein [Rhodococcus spelaei]|uniref:hypothetical protein n=1 Tax=Rhodococcus spelaei TaxID=2546320 RepID=UPI0015EF5FD1|nr:hypothetical protein [Rhodococcus spelaei]
MEFLAALALIAAAPVGVLGAYLTVCALFLTELRRRDRLDHHKPAPGPAKRPRC